MKATIESEIKKAQAGFYNIVKKDIVIESYEKILNTPVNELQQFDLEYINLVSECLFQ